MALPYNEIAIEIQNLVGGPRLSFEVLRHKCDIMRAVLPASELARRPNPVTVDPRWTYFAALTPRDMPVQRILRACGLQHLWFGQAEEDALAVLMMYSDLLDAEIAQRVTQKFDGQCSEDMVKFWYRQNVRSETGSWAWFVGKGDDDAEVKRVLGEFGL
ncbi:MAG: hypothetical protein LQ347_007119 [Umbilicaria vellea]|nr:MAG: hypothetical protein LQ347_007119 [Umbilicaria vellea]